MGTPLKVGGRDQRYSRVTDRKTFDANHDAIFGQPHRKPGRSTVMYRGGERIVLVEGGRVVSKERPTIVKRLSGISVYDALTGAKHDSGTKPVSTTVSDVMRAKEMAPLVDLMNRKSPKG